jgi:hypothetical protein
MFSVLGLVRSPKDTGRGIFLRALTLLPPKPMSGISAGWRTFLLMFILSKVLKKMISAELPISTRIFPIVHPWMFASITRASECG